MSHIRTIETPAPMKNYRIFDGVTQYVAAEQCELTTQNIVFYAQGKIVKTCALEAVSMVEELDDAMRTKKLVFSKNPLHRIEQ